MASSTTLSKEASFLNEYNACTIMDLTKQSGVVNCDAQNGNKHGNSRKVHVHTLSRGIGSDNHRYFRTIPDADKWFSQLDIVQANEHEILTFCDSDDERYIAEWTLNLGVSHLIVTKGAAGVTYYTLDKNNSVIEKYIKAENFNSQNKVGCGDIFGAAAFFYFLASGDMISSVKRANRAAGIVTTFTEIEQFYNLKEHMGNIND